jgi:hypothetical protein
LFGAKLELPTGEIKIVHTVDRYQMHMSMRDLQPDYGQPATIAGKGGFDGMCDRLGKYQHPGQIVIRHIEEFIYFDLWDYEHMPYLQREYIQERIELVILCNLV